LSQARSCSGSSQEEAELPNHKEAEVIEIVVVVVEDVDGVVRGERHKRDLDAVFSRRACCRTRGFHSQRH
jgi:hypothetical protein